MSRTNPSKHWPSIGWEEDDGWSIWCSCGWMADPSPFAAVIGEDFDDHMRLEGILVEDDG